METPRTDPDQSVPHGQSGDPQTQPQAAGHDRPEGEEHPEPHWSPFAPVTDESPSAHTTPPSDLNPDTREQPVVAGPQSYGQPQYGQPGVTPHHPVAPQQAMAPPHVPQGPVHQPGQVPPPAHPPAHPPAQPISGVPGSGPPANAPASASPASGAARPYSVPPHHSPQSAPPQAMPPNPGSVPPPVQTGYTPPGNLPVPYPDQTAVTADDFAQRRIVPPAKPVATTGVRALLRKGTFGLVSLKPGKREMEVARYTEGVRRNFGGLRQITVVNPKGGAGKTVAVLMLAMMFGQRRGGYVLAWDNNETQGTLGMRAQQDFHQRTVRDLLRDLEHFSGPTGRVGDLSQYVRAQGEAMFDVLASDESATAGEMLTSRAFGNIREVVSRFYKLIVVDTGNNVRAANWQSAIDATDQLVVTMSARNDSAETAARMLDHLEQSGRRELVRQAVTVVSMPAHRKDLDLPAVQRHFAARTRMVLLAPYEKLLDSGEPIRYEMLSPATREAWLKIAASVSEGL